jgi:DNA-binding NtrC family response regulator
MNASPQPERSVLVVDDEESQRQILAGFIRKRGLRALVAATVNDAAELVSRQTVDVVITDLNMPGQSGLELLDRVRAINPEIPVIVVTAFGTVATAVDAMKRGAADYLTKPIDLEELEVLIDRTLERRALVSENRQLRQALESHYRLEGLETLNPRMQETISLAARAAGSMASVLIVGESGTGKELVARAMHPAGERSRGPLVAVNVAALAETLVESELFGHERGAFTGADRERRGRFELAHGGTLFLDEVADLPKSAQLKLLRVLQEHSFERVGGTRSIQVDVRIIAATNRPLDELVTSGAFRQDLFYRLNVITIPIPPLRQRREDIPLLVDRFLRRFAGERQSGPMAVSKEAMDLLVKYAYPGNVRELENIVHRAMALARGSSITSGDLPAHVRELQTEATAAGPRESPLRFVDAVADFERHLIDEAMAAADGVQSRAARALGMSERHLRYKLRKYRSGGGASSGEN